MSLSVCLIVATVSGLATLEARASGLSLSPASVFSLLRKIDNQSHNDTAMKDRLQPAQLPMVSNYGSDRVPSLRSAKYAYIAHVFLRVSQRAPMTSCNHSCVQARKREKFLCAPSVKSHSVKVLVWPNQTENQCSYLSLFTGSPPPNEAPCYSELWLPSAFTRSLIPQSNSSASNLLLHVSRKGHFERHPLSLKRLQTKQNAWTVLDVSGWMPVYVRKRLRSVNDSEKEDSSFILKLCAELSLQQQPSADESAMGRNSKVRLQHIKATHQNQLDEPFMVTGEDLGNSFGEIFSDARSKIPSGGEDTELPRDITPTPLQQLVNIHNHENSDTAGAQGSNEQRTSRPPFSFSVSGSSAASSCSGKVVIVDSRYLPTISKFLIAPTRFEMIVCSGACSSREIPPHEMTFQGLLMDYFRSARENYRRLPPVGGRCCVPVKHKQQVNLLLGPAGNFHIRSESMTTSCGCR